MFRFLNHIALLGFLSSTAHAAACTRCPISITYTTPAGCPAINCLEPTCTVTTTTSIPTSYCATKTRTACVRSCAPCYTETITVEDDPVMVQPTIAPEPSTEQPIADPEPTIIQPTINPGGPIILPTSEPSPTNIPGQCAPYTVTTTATNPACTFDTSECIRPLCVFETTTTVPSCGEAVTQTEVAVCETECPAGCATFTYTATSGAEVVATPIATLD
ncbi:hypothetical protein D6C78_02866 [Aureobasidium pullulans]|uniref:Uncharacterized protein n=1 Tax=Aureobasidium pullulans TaxID=5580 RepID=A0A4V6T8L6_AURPU|nr:hypothetical protein D6D27_05844 [Aureobasidium pullulans]THW07504.1 hypothetical protein D6D25_08015 [Aureobasidium pullulans]THX35193.1 hypothetical protein D6D10_07358 [Aureobasidium pullulans]TIA40026.1 hypothetical protein D6C78_02866 [Aureobasidium pullulans]